MLDSEVLSMRVVGDQSIAERVQALSSQATGLVKEHILSLETALKSASQLADEISKGGDLYHSGIRELCSRLREDLHKSQQNIESLRSR